LQPRSEDAVQGTIETADGYRVAMDSRAFLAANPPIRNFFSQVAAPFRLAAGSEDPMVSLNEMLELDPDAVVIEGAGHNVHYERPRELWDAIASVFL
jgi:pimeloyl-ACP methyl ester carboxylesterase